MYKHKECQW